MADNEVSKLKLTDGNVVSLKDATSRTGIENITKQIESLQRGYVPAGTILQGLYAAAPTGFLLCNGQEVAIASYPELYAVIGKLPGCQSSNAGMFRVPDLRGRFLEGANGNLGNRIEAGLPNITGSFGAQGSTAVVNLGEGAFRVKQTGKIDAVYSGDDYYSLAQSFDASRSSSIYGKSSTVQPPAVCVNYIIKY